MNKTEYWQKRCELAEWLREFTRGTIQETEENEYRKKLLAWMHLVNNPIPSDKELELPTDEEVEKMRADKQEVFRKGYESDGIKNVPEHMVFWESVNYRLGLTEMRSLWIESNK